MTWRSVLAAEPGGWDRLEPAQLATWLDDELDGRGLLGPRDDAEPADVMRDAAERGGTSVRHRIEEALTATFCRRFDRVDAAGECSGPERLPLAFAARAMERLPVRPEVASVERLGRGVFADWARVRVDAHAAPHPLRQSFARAWLAVAAPSGPDLRRLLADPELVNLGMGTLYGDLRRAVEYLPDVVETLVAAGRNSDLVVHLVVLRDRYGGVEVRDELGERIMTRPVRLAVDAALRQADIVPRSSKVLSLDEERAAKLLGIVDAGPLPKAIRR